MALYQITARRINDRPDKDGWHSSGEDLPVFWVDAVSVANAASIGHDIAGLGSTELTRTILQVYREVGDDEEIADSTQWWVDGRKVEPTRVMRQYGCNGQDITSQPLYAEQDADEVTWFTVGGCRWLRLTRSPHGKWAITASDFVQLRTSDYDRRFSTPDEALGFSKDRARGPLVEVTEW
jgi:hypothetical protein